MKPMKAGLIVLGMLAFGAVIATVMGVSSKGRDHRSRLPTIETVGLPEHQIVLIGPTDQSFSNLLSQHLAKSGASKVDQMAQYSVFVENRSQRSIAGLSTKWEVLNSDGRSLTRDSTFLAGLRVIANGEFAQLEEGLAIGSYRLISAAGVDDPSGRIRISTGGGKGGGLLQRVKERVKVTVWLDGVLFVDGTYVGPDTLGFFERAKTNIESMRDVLEETRRALNGDAEASKQIALLTSE